MEVIEDLWFSHYSDEFLTKFLPVTVFLCSEIDSVQMSFVWTPSFHTEYTGKKVRKAEKSERHSVLAKLNQFKELVKAPVPNREKRREQER